MSGLAVPGAEQPSPPPPSQQHPGVVSLISLAKKAQIITTGSWTFQDFAGYNLWETGCV